MRDRGHGPSTLSRELGVSRFTIQRWLAGSATPRAHVLVRLAIALGTTAEDLLSPKQQAERSAP